MKDIYELLNDIEVDGNEEGLAPVSEVEKKRLKMALNHQIVKAKKQSKWKRGLSIAIVSFGLITSSMVGLSFTTYAENIPFLGNIFKFFNDNGSYEGYYENAEKLELFQESNGINMTINETVFDGKSLYVTYMIESSKDLGVNPWINTLPIYDDTGVSGSNQMTKIDEGKYIGLLQVQHSSQKHLDEIDVIWHIESISTEANNEGTIFEGNWDFQFNVAAVESQNIVVNETITDEGITFTANNIMITPMSLILSYQHVVALDVTNDWDNLYVNIDVSDDQGNSYTTLNQVGEGSLIESLNWIATYHKLDPDATQLIISPIIKLSDNETIGFDENGKAIKADYRLVDSIADYKEVQLEKIIVELK